MITRNCFLLHKNSPMSAAVISAIRRTFHNANKISFLRREPFTFVTFASIKADMSLSLISSELKYLAPLMAGTRGKSDKILHDSMIKNSD